MAYLFKNFILVNKNLMKSICFQVVLIYVETNVDKWKYISLSILKPDCFLHHLPTYPSFLIESNRNWSNIFKIRARFIVGIFNEKNSLLPAEAEHHAFVALMSILIRLLYNLRILWIFTAYLFSLHIFGLSNWTNIHILVVVLC